MKLLYVIPCSFYCCNAFFHSSGFLFLVSYEVVCPVLLTRGRLISCCNSLYSFKRSSFSLTNPFFSWIVNWYKVWIDDNCCSNFSFLWLCQRLSDPVQLSRSNINGLFSWLVLLCSSFYPDQKSTSFFFRDYPTRYLYSWLVNVFPDGYQCSWPETEKREVPHDTI